MTLIIKSFVIFMLIISTAFSADIRHAPSNEARDYPPDDVAESIGTIKQENISNDHLIMPDGTILSEWLRLNRPDLSENAGPKVK